MQFYLTINGQQQGPFTLDEIRQRIRYGSLSLSTLAWYEGQSSWIPLSDIPEITIPLSLPSDIGNPSPEETDTPISNKQSHSAATLKNISKILYRIGIVGAYILLILLSSFVGIGHYRNEVEYLGASLLPLLCSVALFRRSLRLRSEFLLCKKNVQSIFGLYYLSYFSAVWRWFLVFLCSAVIGILHVEDGRMYGLAVGGAIGIFLIGILFGIDIPFRYFRKFKTDGSSSFKEHRIGWIILLCVMLLPFSVVVIKSLQHKKTLISAVDVPAISSQENAEATLQTTSVTGTPNELFKKLSPRIVSIITLDRFGFPLKYGSGVAIGPSKVKEDITGVESDFQNATDIVTNFHLIDHSQLIVIQTKQGILTDAQIVYFDRKTDLALLRIPGKITDTDIPFASSVNIGDPVLAIGNPEGFDFTLSTGIISRVPDSKDSLLQTTTPISHGSSGGGLFDYQGNLIGITTIGMKDAQNLNFAIWMYGNRLSEITKARHLKGNTFFTATRKSDLYFNYTIGRYPATSYYKKLPKSSIRIPEEDGSFKSVEMEFEITPDMNLSAPEPVFKSEEALTDFVKENITDSAFRNYILLKRQLSQAYAFYAKQNQALYDSQWYNNSTIEQRSAASNKLFDIQNQKTEQLVNSLHAAFPFDEDIAEDFIGRIEDQSAKEKILSEFLAQWPDCCRFNYPYGQWLQKYISCLLSQGKFQKTREILEEYRNYLTQAPPKFLFTDPKSKERTILFEGYSKIDREQALRGFNAILNDISSNKSAVKYIPIQELVIPLPES